MDEAVRTPANAMLTTPVRHSLNATVREIREFFDDDHVHAALIVGPAGYLAAVVERADLPRSLAADTAAISVGRLAGRIVPGGASLTAIQRAMIATGRRRAAVVSEDGLLLGLLCLKANRAGFCSEDDVGARALDESGGPKMASNRE